MTDIWSIIIICCNNYMGIKMDHGVDEVEIDLPRHDEGIILKKSSILNSFPESLLATILEQDPTATKIELTQPFLTRDILVTLDNIMFIKLVPQAWEYNREIFNLTMEEVLHDDFRQASRYLGIPVLGIIGSPMWVRLHEYLAQKGISFNILYPQMSWDNLKEALAWCFKNNANELGSYLLENTEIIS